MRDSPLLSLKYFLDIHHNSVGEPGEVETIPRQAFVDFRIDIQSFNSELTIIQNTNLFWWILGSNDIGPYAPAIITPSTVPKIIAFNQVILEQSHMEHLE